MMDINERCYGYEPAQSQLNQLQLTIKELKMQLAEEENKNRKCQNTICKLLDPTGLLLPQKAASR